MSTLTNLRLGTEEDQIEWHAALFDLTDGQILARTPSLSGHYNDVTARIVACVNACAGIPTELLPSGGFLERQLHEEAVLKATQDQREHLRAALEMARNGLLWYQDRYPAEVNGCDDEAMATIAAALGGST